MLDEREIDEEHEDNTTVLSEEAGGPLAINKLEVIFIKFA